jgi:hypothetical protein
MFNIQTTEEYKTINELQLMQRYSEDALKSFIEMVNIAYNAFWYGEISPIVKIEKLGTEAINIFTASAQAQAFIKSQKPEYVELGIPEGFEIKWNEDGSGIINILEITENNI